jgi:ferritin-like metal-binding protein YciE
LDLNRHRVQKIESRLQNPKEVDVEFKSLSDVLVEEVADLYSAEQQLVEGLPRLAAAAHSYELRDALEAHLEQTRGHVERLKQVAVEIGLAMPGQTTCEAMRGLVADAAKTAEATGDAVAIDAALIGAAQRIEHYELAAYGTARVLARELNFDAAASLLDQTIDEERDADKQLTKLAEGGLLSSGINRMAANRTDDPATEEEHAAEQ